MILFQCSNFSNYDLLIQSKSTNSVIFLFISYLTSKINFY